MKLNLLKITSITIIVFWIVAFFILPILLIILSSVLSSDNEKILKLPFTLNSYKELFSYEFLRVMLRTIWLAGQCSVICLLIAYPFSYFLSLKKNRTFIFAFVLIPFWTSSLVRTFSLVGLLKSKGIINTLLLNMGLIKTPLEILYTPRAILIGLSYTLLPFTIIPLYNCFLTFDRTLLTAAKDLNASPYTIFKKIILPHSSNGIINAITFTFFPAMTMFYISDILGGARSLLLGNYISNQFLLLRDWPKGAAISLSLILLLFSFLAAYHLRKKVQ